MFEDILANPDVKAAAWVTFRLAALSTVILLCVCLPLGWTLARSRTFGGAIMRTLLSLPVVLPPTVLGFYLLMSLGPHSFMGRWFSQLTDGHSLVFSFSGLVVGSLVYSLPFCLQPILSSFESIGARPIELGQMLGHSRLSIFFRVIIPLARHGIFAAAIMAFCHTVGEFGVILMLGGNITGETKVLSVLLYEMVESLRYDEAQKLSLLLVGFSFTMLVIVQTLFYRNKQKVAL